ncbi:hypothetical protein CA13_33770 [Planctomycetes bacterium CA13]|uniref:Bifunctional 3-demethylubiquinone-9 3-methyltransferase/ 2-octaprenyl-6-hydroxy phenol methylase n=2 Tax=Novipirellula herctigrandis TaxID=2527986 RepID=A0A5C5Z3F9_9BACT|nr:hypothetical protein CA13_33770 [Planctomycetes bacterium CA13]
MKLLVGIVNYGTANDHYLERVLSDLRSISIDKDIVLFCDRPKDFGSDVEVRIGVPDEGPLYMPLLPRRLFAEKAGQYDVYIGLEDDTPIEERHVRAFVEASNQCDEKTMPGFLRWEHWPDGSVHIDTVHRNFSWDPFSPTRFGDWVFAELTNLQAAVLMFTQKHLDCAMASPHFCDIFSPTRVFQLIERASTQLFEECGLRRVIPVSHIDDFLFPHLANRFHKQRIGLRRALFDAQIKALIETADGKKTPQKLLEPFTALASPTWDKNFDETEEEVFLEPSDGAAREMLWLGASGSDAEHALVKSGHNVTGIPLDSIVSASAESIGVKVTSASWSEAKKELHEKSFDVICVAHMLERLEDPVGLLEWLDRCLTDGGSIVATVPNFDCWWNYPDTSKSMKSQTGFESPWTYNQTGLHFTTPRLVRDWFRDAGFDASIELRLTDGCKRYHWMTLGLAKKQFSREMVIRATSRR